MKKAKFTTKRRSELEEAQSTFAEFGTKYIKRWTEQELKQYRTQPVVIPVGDHGFFVGYFRITGVHPACWTVGKIDGRHIHDFTSKAAAIIYCISEVKQRYQEAQNLLDLDTQLGRLELNIINYEHTLSKTQDSVKFAVVLNRCIDAKTQRRHLLDILKKTLNSAKYLNFGKLPL